MKREDDTKFVVRDDGTVTRQHEMFHFDIRKNIYPRLVGEFSGSISKLRVVATSIGCFSFIHFRS